MTSFDPDKVRRIHRDLHSHLPPEPALRMQALESLLVDKGLLDTATVDAWVQAYSEEIGPRRGAQVVARAWVDPEFKADLLTDAEGALERAGFTGYATLPLEVVANTDDVHNLVVCTLCSCYPLSLLGIPPAWYKSAAYRARAVRDARGVLREFGVALDDDVEVRVWDSTAELRYLVLPQRPPATADWDEGRLAGVVTRNAMIGTQRDLTPA